MIKLTEIIKNVDTLDGILSVYREQTNWTDWFMSGGCYTFADAIYQFLGKKGKFISVGEYGTNDMAHVCILYNGLYCDYNGCRTKTDIANDVAVYGKLEWKLKSQKDMVGEHNYSSNEVRKILKDLTIIKNKLK
jgi:hypothetical protein